MTLLERDRELGDLATAARAALDGHGEVVLVHGEAGIGKSSLVAALRADPPNGCRVLVGSCDALATPRTLGPLRDLAPFVGARLAGALRAGDREEVFDALRDELAGSPGTVLVVEDVHWADEGTLDALTFVARRIDALPVLLVLTYRDDEVDQGHPLARLLGDVHANVRHLAIARLSRAAVAGIAADRGLDPEQVFDLTLGNPYFVGELVASADADHVPRSVVDAVTGRLHRLPPDVRVQVEQLAVIPSAVDSAEVARLVAGGAAALGAAEERGLLTVRPGGVAFRHELTRRAIVDAMPTARRIELNTRVLAVLLELGADPARIVSHAVEAGDGDAVAAWAPTAARDAAVSGAHRQAAAHYRAALEHGGDDSERVDLMEAYAIELYTLGFDQEAVQVQSDVIGARRAGGDPTALGASLRWASRFHWLAGQRREAEAAAREASACLATSEDRSLFALALSNEAQLAMLAHDLARTLELAPQAVAIARETGDRRALSHSLNNLGTAHLLMNRDEGIAELVEAADVATAANLMDDAARAHVNLVWSLLDQYRLELAERHLDAALETSSRAEVMGLWTYQQVERARLHLARAEWEQALVAAAHGREALPHAHCVALTVIGLVQVRTGDAAGERTLSEAAEVAARLGEFQRTGPVAAARAEAALLRDDRAAAVAIAGSAYEEARRLGAGNEEAELASLLRRAGAFGVAAPEGEHPFAVQARGDWRAAAGLWHSLGAPYHEAAALAESPHEADLLEALAILDRLGALPLAHAVRADLRARGARSVPRGPSGATRRNPVGLTDRQVDVLALLADGLTNSEIADRLVLSVRTVESHVAAILQKLDASSRQDAVLAAHRLGVLAD
ncbi:regulatory protein, luxR family [Agromyces sp. CF514]|uniref:ATP-binding protein n=1 Tax=Agromyces sp. CF514 TaxID=1881031 RepID=UPI0008F0B359|nr:LuxR family transcriptional regulator [Agromyces sp. CF514]SFR69024.1 regulatory protein, luxR family [Agromyces sp. CF514]